uniref:Uncharacterized protein n=1 Tax=Clastoptera arizonana TaxID=38151 RepID=A0A1B6DF66_9HEMI
MDCNLFPAGERILADIESIFKKDLKLNEFVITLVEMNENKSPVNHMDHCLCLESWCVPYLYNYTHIRLKELRKQKKRDLSGHNKLLIGALLLNPDVTLFWNMRRELVTNLRIDPQFELQFTSVILSRKPKSPEVFSYRKWVLTVSNYKHSE